MVYDATRSTYRPLERAQADEKITELERIGAPSQFDRGTLTAVRLSRLEPDERKRVDALVARWAKATE
jgi:hypothetical protein